MSYAATNGTFNHKTQYHLWPLPAPQQLQVRDYVPTDGITSLQLWQNSVPIMLPFWHKTEYCHESVCVWGGEGTWVKSEWQTEIFKKVNMKVQSEFLTF